MFDTTAIKNKSRRTIDKIQPKTLAEVLSVSGQAQVIPYFEMVPGQFSENKSYVTLSRADQGDFLRMAIFMWRGGGAIIDHPTTAIELGMTPDEWSAFVKRLLDAELCRRSDDSYYIVQPELRNQYLQSLELCWKRIDSGNRSAEKRAANQVKESMEPDSGCTF